MEGQTWEALKGSSHNLVPFLSPDCVMIFPGATIFDQSSDPSLSDILTRADMKPWIRYEMDNVRVVQLGENAATICYEVEANREEENYEAMISSTWRRESSTDQWKLCVHQQTPINVA